MDIQPAEVISRKRDGHPLSDNEIRQIIERFSVDDLPDYQMSALAMAIFLNGMDARETTTLTRSMLESGETLRWTDEDSLRVDKHSTGGVGDKVSLILAPLLAACGVQVPMISGRGLGPTGGTLDKLESIPGFRTNLTQDEIRATVARVGCVITAATDALAPADRKLYALRDVTATVPSVPLITASILSKKLAAGLDALILDVKFGSGAFMKTVDDARLLARSLVRTADQLGLPTGAVLSDMNQPLGQAVGNLLEVRESLEVLEGGGPADVRQLTLVLAQQLLAMAGLSDVDIETRLDNGEALELFNHMVTAQGGQLEGLADSPEVTELAADKSGWLTEIDSEQLGRAVIQLGGGRRQMGDAIDHRVGLETLVRIGDPVEQGQPLVLIYTDDLAQAAHVRSRLKAAITLSDEPCTAPDLIAEAISLDSLE